MPLYRMSQLLRDRLRIPTTAAVGRVGRVGRVSLAVVLVGTAGVLGALSLGGGWASAHGSLQSPISRVYGCFQEGPEHPQSAACQAAIAAGGTQAVYDWNGVSQMSAGDQYQKTVPDGQLCSGGNPEYKGFDLARDDWPATNLVPGAPYTFVWAATAPHVGVFRFYLTNDAYDPSQPLRWSDLNPQPFLTVEHPPLSDGTFQMAGQVPTGRAGRHIIYTVYERTDSTEDFFACSDVVFGAGGDTTAPTARDGSPMTPNAPAASPTMEERLRISAMAPLSSVTPSASPSPTAAPPAGAPVAGAAAAWQPNVMYDVGATVSYAGMTYVCLSAHTSLTGWEPPNVPSLWRATPVAGSDAWTPGVYYATGTTVTYSSVRYVCRQSHTAQAGWEPPNTPALWQQNG